MSTADAPTRHRTATARERSGAGRRRGGTALVAGGVVLFLLMVAPGSAPFYWLPVITGLTYLAAAAAAGARGALYAPGLLVLGFGVSTVLSGRGVVEGAQLALALVCVGAGAVIAVLLRRVGVAVSAESLAVTVLVLGLFVLLSTKIAPGGIGGEAWFYAALLVGWGAWELRPAR